MTAFNFCVGKLKEVQLAVGMAGSASTLPCAKIYFNDESPSLTMVHSHLDVLANIFSLIFLKKNKYLITLAENNQQYVLSAFNVFD